MSKVRECILYRDFEQGDILDKMTQLIDSCASEEQTEELREMFYSCVNGLVEMAGAYGFAGDLWHCYLTYLLVNHENAFSTACEIVGPVEGSICLLYTSQSPRDI